LISSLGTILYLPTNPGYCNVVGREVVLFKPFLWLKVCRFYSQKVLLGSLKNLHLGLSGANYSLECFLLVYEHLCFVHKLLKSGQLLPSQLHHQGPIGPNTAVQSRKHSLVSGVLHIHFLLIEPHDVFF